MSDLRLEDLSPEDRRALKHNDPLLDEYAVRMEREYKLPSGLLVALKNAGERSESTGKNSVSPKGAVGVMQLMPGTAKQHGIADPTDPMEAIRGSATHVASLSDQLNTQDPSLLAAAYNAGPNRPSIRRGEVPKIPETQAYVQRVNAQMAAQAKPPAEDVISPEDMLPEDRGAATRAAMAKEYSPTSGMSNTELALAGAGKSVVDTARGVGQLAADWVVNPASRALIGRDAMDNMRGDQAEADARDRALMSTLPGNLGYAGGTMATMAVPAAAITKAAPVVKAAQALSQVPRVGGALSLALPAAVTGTALGAAAPVVQEGDRARNMATQGTLGPLTVLGMEGLSRGAGKLASTPMGQRVVEAVKAPFRAAGEFAEAVPGYGPAKSVFQTAVVGPSHLKGMSETERAAVETASKQGVPVYGSQLRKPGSALPASRTDEQRSAFSRAISRQFGENTDDVNMAFRNAEQRLGDNYQKLLGGKNLPIDAKTHLSDLADITKFNTSRSPRFAPNPDLQDAVERAAAAAKQSGAMTGEDFQQALRGYKAAAKQAMKGTELRPSDPHAAEGYNKLIDALTKQAENSLSKEELALFRQTNKEWRNMSMLDAIAPRDVNGAIDPRQLANLLSRKDKNAFVYGKGDQTLPNLAKYGVSYMEQPGTVPKGVVAKMGEMVNKTAPTVVGDLAAGVVLSEGLTPNEHESLPEKLGKYAAWALAADVGRRGYGRVTNPALLMPDLKAPQGALARIAAAGYPTGISRALMEREKE